MMSSRDYIELAAIVRELPHWTTGPAAEGAADPVAIGNNVRTGAAKLLATFCATDNARFDRARFYAACGLDTDGGVTR